MQSPGPFPPMPSPRWPGASWAILVKNSPASAFAKAARTLEQAAEALDPAQTWRQQDGLCARLQEAAALGLPSRDPWDLPDLEEETAFSQLLREARQWQREQAGEA
jgi:hypothetical protein